jgi:hypothetical protein
MRNMLLDGEIDFENLKVPQKMFLQMPSEFITEKNILRILKYLKENEFENVFETSKKSKSIWSISTSGANILYTGLMQQKNIDTLKETILNGSWEKYGVKEDFLIDMYNKYKSIDENSTIQLTI